MRIKTLFLMFAESAATLIMLMGMVFCFYALIPSPQRVSDVVIAEASHAR